MPRVLPEVRAASRFLEAIDGLGFDEGAFVAYVSRASFALRERFLRICLAFIDNEAEAWYSEVMEDGTEDHHREAARMSEAFNVFRYNP